jgi:hypothetical protein
MNLALETDRSKEMSSSIRSKARLSALIFLVLAASSVRAETHLIYFGGGGEQAQPANRFDTSFSDIVEAAKVRNWKAEYFVDKNHPSTKNFLAFLKPKIGASPVSEFTPNAAKERLKELRENLGKYKDGDQLFIAVNTHGALLSATAIDARGEDAVLLSTAKEMANLTAELKLLVEEANKEKRRITLDLTNCYSGTLLKLLDQLGEKNEYVCIIAASQPRRLSYFAYDGFYKVLQRDSSKDMEFAFRMNRISPGELNYQPMINTPAGIRAARALSFIKDFAYHPIDEDVAAEDRVCSNPNLQVKNLRRLGQAMAHTTDENLFKLWKSEGEEISKAIDELIDARMKHEENERNFEKLNEESVYGLDLGSCLDKAKNKKFSPELAAHLGVHPDQICGVVHNLNEQTLRDMQSSAAHLQKLLNNPSTPEPIPYELLNPGGKTLTGGYVEQRSRTHAEAKHLLSAYEQSIELAKKQLRNPDFLKAQETIKKDREKLTALQATKAARLRLAQRMMEKERFVYEVLYEHFAHQTKDQPNPCRDFKL